MKLGVVLSGGGAKGAYEAGFLKALSELNIQPDAIAGTSIGAITGAICSANIDIHKSADIVEKLWLELARETALQFDKKKLHLNLIDVISFFAPIPQTNIVKIINSLKISLSKEGILTNLPLINRLQKYAPPEMLKTGLPFYVGYSKSYGNFLDLLHFLNLKEIDAEYKKIQDLSDNEIHKAIMASAALPLLFDAIEVEGEHKRDGCLASQKEEWGNTPAYPLVKYEKCTHLIICHLNKGSSFNRLNPIFKNIPIIEIRPNENIFNNSLDSLSFKIEKIKEWMDFGYKDSIKILKDSIETIKLIQKRKAMEMLSDYSIEKLKNRNFKLNFDD